MEGVILKHIDQKFVLIPILQHINFKTINWYIFCFYNNNMKGVILKSIKQTGKTGYNLG